jgi:hypothetical protein
LRSDVSLGDCLLSVTTRSLEVRRDGKLLFHADRPVEIRQVRFQRGKVQAEVRAATPCTLRVGDKGRHDISPGLTRVGG